MSELRSDIDVATLNARGVGHLPGLLGLELVELESGWASSRLPLRTELLAPNGYLHAGSVVALADTTCGYATMAHLPKGATSFTTIELKSNHLGTLTEGTVLCYASAQHLGRTTQVWDAVVTDEGGRKLALFRCTQMILWPKPAA